MKRGKWTDQTLESYLFRALRDKEAEYWRSKRRREISLMPEGQEIDQQDPPESWTPARPEATIDLVLTESAVRQVLDEDAMAYAVLHAMGFTVPQIAGKLGWSHKKAEAARIRLARRKKAVALAVLGHIPEHIKEEVRNVD